MRLLQENNMKIGPNMLNNIFSALRTLQPPRLLHKTYPVCQHFARLHAPCAQEAVEQNADAVGKSYPAVEETSPAVDAFSHGIYVLFHDFPLLLPAVRHAVDAVEEAFLRHLRARGVGWA